MDPSFHNYLHSNKNLFLGSYDASVRLWDVRSNSYEPIQKLTEAKDSVSSVKISDYGTLTGYFFIYFYFNKIEIIICFF